MFASFTLTVKRYLSFYEQYFTDLWRDMSPEAYVAILSLVGFIGWMLMRSGTKKC